VTYALVYYLTLATQAASRRAVPTALYRGNSTAARETSEAVTGDKNSAQQSAAAGETPKVLDGGEVGGSAFDCQATAVLANVHSKKNNSPILTI